MGLRGRIGIICGLHSDNFINSFIAASFVTERQKKFWFPEPKSAIFDIFFYEGDASKCVQPPDAEQHHRLDAQMPRD
jgi:hypothetical protein